MSKKKGQKNRHDPVIPMNLKQLFRLSPIERKAIARKIKLKSGAKVWWDELAMDNAENKVLRMDIDFPPGTSQIVEHRRAHARVMRGVEP